MMIPSGECGVDDCTYVIPQPVVELGATLIAVLLRRHLYHALWTCMVDNNNHEGLCLWWKRQGPRPVCEIRQDSTGLCYINVTPFTFCDKGLWRRFEPHQIGEVCEYVKEILQGDMAPGYWGKK